MKKTATLLLVFIGLFFMSACARSTTEKIMEEMGPTALRQVRMRVSFGLDVNSIDWIYEERSDADEERTEYIYYFVVEHEAVEHYAKVVISKIDAHSSTRIYMFESDEDMREDYDLTLERIETDAARYEDEETVHHYYKAGSFEGLEITAIMRG